jgi:amidophosphoribosyltransferase
MTNVEELFNVLVDLGQHPKDKVDTVTVMEKIGHFLDEEVINRIEMQMISMRIKKEWDLPENF